MNKIIPNDIFTCLKILYTMSHCFGVKLSEDFIYTIRNTIFKDINSYKALDLFNCYKLATNLIASKQIPKEQYKIVANNYIGVYKSLKEFTKSNAPEENLEDNFIDYEAYTKHLFEEKYFYINDSERNYVFKSQNYLENNTIINSLTKNDIFAFLISTTILLSHYETDPDELLSRLINSTRYYNLIDGFKIAIELIIKKKITNKNFSSVADNYIGKYPCFADFVIEHFSDKYLFQNIRPSITDFVEPAHIDYQTYEEYILENSHFYLDVSDEAYVFSQQL